LPQFTTQIITIYNCSLERAFKSPMLCDIKKVHSGYLFMPKVTHCKNDETWGKVGGSRLCFFAPSLFSRVDGTALDTVLERKENEYWKIEIGDLSMPSVGIKKFQGEWTTVANLDGTVTIFYRYTLFTNSTFAYPFHWLFTKIFWRM